MTNHDQDARIRQLLVQAYPAENMLFEAGFADRVMTRAQRGDAVHGDMSMALLRQGRRILPVLLAASLALVAWNITTTRSSADSLVTAALGLASWRGSVGELPLVQGAEAFQ